MYKYNNSSNIREYVWKPIIILVPPFLCKINQKVQGKAVKQEDFDTVRLSPDGLRRVRNMTLGVKTVVIFSPHDGLNQ